MSGWHRACNLWCMLQRYLITIIVLWGITGGLILLIACVHFLGCPALLLAGLGFMTAMVAGNFLGQLNGER
jgi:hypothetical protein